MTVFWILGYNNIVKNEASIRVIHEKVAESQEGLFRVLSRSADLEILEKISLAFRGSGKTLG